MNTNPFNICPSCIEVDTCVLTKSKEKVWSCSEYNEVSEIVEKEKKEEAVVSLEIQVQTA
ncbi:hypothetical protein [Tenacibaculum larymnensis]|uniref:Uncharacterized protein n=1 Tax=Tenacibaculum larymnensis TaxID=2878201 RepID=A0A9X4IMW2_9FLAO|nr:hypothetical protein [Tenacibaculum larymnensis]MDE1208149.1 hypothetical protein [Tenacibaculum larymnensis]